MMSDQKDLLAKLLATENITVVRGNASTASFNTQTRVLTLPQWKDMTLEQEEMLIGHEVGHALYTTNDYAEDLQSSRALMSYMNVIEDVRIEKLIKKKYPGLKKSFTTAYKQLQEKDFFGVGDRDLKSLLFIDRANLYYKAGFNCGVTFTADEMAWMKRIDSCETMKDVYNLAVELLGWTREERKKMKEELMKMSANLPAEEQEEDEDDFNDDFNNDMFDDLEDGEESDAEGDSDEQGDENGSTENKSNEQSSEDSTSLEQSEEESAGNYQSRGVTENPDVKQPQKIDEDVLEDCQSLTDAALSKNLADQADTTKVRVNIDYTTGNIYNEVLVPYKTVLAELTADYRDSWKVSEYTDFFNKRTEDAEKFLQSCVREVNYLVKEFEMRKQADRYARAQTAKSGEINVNKLYAYKLKEDLFKRVTTLADGKNHGMVMLLDWSGSMQHTMYDTLKQTVVLAMFCNRIRIPYRVFAFTNGRREQDFSWDKRNAMQSAFMKNNPNSIGLDHFNMIEFFSNEMKAVDFNLMAKFLLIGPFNFSRQYTLNSTPLNEALWWTVDYMGKFVKANNVQIPTLITLTDGEGHGLSTYFTDEIRYGKDENGNKKMNDVTVNFVDPITHRVYKAGRYGSDQTKALLKMIKDRHNCNVVGFHIIRNNRRDISCFIRSNTSVESYFENEKMINDIRSNFRNEGFMSVNSPARDAMFVIASNKLKMEEDELAVTGQMTANQIARKFTKHLDTRRTSKILLNQFVGMVA